MANHNQALKSKLLEYMKGQNTTAVQNARAMSVAVHADRLDVNACLELLQLEGLVNECYIRDRRTGAFYPHGWLLTMAGATLGSPAPADAEVKL